MPTCPKCHLDHERIADEVGEAVDLAMAVGPALPAEKKTRVLILAMLIVAVAMAEDEMADDDPVMWWPKKNVEYPIDPIIDATRMARAVTKELRAQLRPRSRCH